MLVLTRKLMEKLYIGDEICVTVVRVEGGQVRLGIDAPREISVVRAELVAGRAGQRPRAPEPAPASAERDRLRYSPSEVHAVDTRRRARFR
jgi:carbon storage regulator